MNLSAQRADAIQAYRVKDFKTSAAIRKTIVDSSEYTPEDQLYLGLSLLYQSPPQANDAIMVFETILADDDVKSDEEARWFLALAYLQADQVDAAKEVLQEIVDNNSWNAKNASEIITELEEID